VNGVAYVVYGQQAQYEAEQSIASLLKHNDLPVKVITEYQFDVDQFRTDEQKSRLAKVNLPRLVDFDKVLYLDADTRIKCDITPGFDLLDNWDLAIAPSRNQGNDLFRHIQNSDEKEQTLHELGNFWPMQLQAGVMFFHRQRCAKLFDEWARQWNRWQGQDQAALLRALAIEPVRIWLLGRCWNGGEIVEHLFGKV
jgi:hypothetical protein